MSGEEAEHLELGDVLELVREYVTGVSSQNSRQLADAFAETAHIVGIDEGQPVSIPRDRWIDTMCKPERQGMGSESYQIGSVNLAGSVATMTIVTTYGRFRYVDLLTVMKHGKRTRIMQKCFHQAPGSGT